MTVVGGQAEASATLPVGGWTKSSRATHLASESTNGGVQGEGFDHYLARALG